MKPVRLAIADAGRIGQAHLQVVLESPDCVRTAIVDPAPAAPDIAASARSWEQTSPENKACASYDDEDCHVVSGTNGSLAIPTMRLKTCARPQDRSWCKPFETDVVALARDAPPEHQLAHFCALARGETEPLVSARDGRANPRVTDAIEAATASGATVKITR